MARITRTWVNGSQHSEASVRRRKRDWRLVVLSFVPLVLITVIATLRAIV